MSLELMLRGKDTEHSNVDIKKFMWLKPGDLSPLLSLHKYKQEHEPPKSYHPHPTRANTQWEGTCPACT